MQDMNVSAKQTEALAKTTGADTASVRIARAAPHFFEEPCISGERGSGAVFFVGCLLNCVYCQNRAISHPREPVGRRVSVKELAEIFLRLQDEEHTHNINLVTATHVAGPVVRALEIARSSGLTIPVVYNTSGYETSETLRALSGLVDVYLPDLKYLTSTLAHSLSGKEDYPEVAMRALAEMVRQTGGPVFDEAGMMTRGTLARHLVLPAHTQEAKKVLSYLYETYGDRIYISILRQYTPMPDMTGELARRVTKREYDRVVDYAISLGITNAFLQEDGAADEAYIPAWE